MKPNHPLWMVATETHWLARGSILGLLTGFALRTSAAVMGLTVTPAAISNDFIGEITLAITNLPSGKTVRVEMYADLNTNGVIDAGDLLFRSFQVTDGQVPLVAGVRNLNLPGDEDGLTNGQIQAAVSFPSAGGTAPSLQSLVRVSDPAGVLTAVTQSFSVSQRIYPQAVTGRITFAGSGLPVTNTVVGLPGLSTIVNFGVTDTNGNYCFYCIPGLHVVEGLNRNGAIFNGSAIVAVACGQMVTNNLVLAAGTFFIAGRVTDAASGAGIPALSLDANTSSGLAVLTLTDTNGNYVLQVTANTWSIHPSTGSAPEAGYLDPTRVNISVTSASVSNVNFALASPTAIVHGRVKDALNNPVLGVQLSARDQPNNYHAVGRSAAPLGSYTLAVQAGTWNPAPDGNDLGNRGFVGTGGSVMLVAGQSTNLDFIVTRTNWPVLQLPLRLSNSQFQFLINGLAGQPYIIQSATNLGAHDWLVVFSTNLPCNTAQVVDPQATNSARFYRAMVQQ